MLSFFFKKKIKQNKIRSNNQTSKEPQKKSSLTEKEQKILDSIPVGTNYARPVLEDAEVMIATYRSDPRTRDTLKRINKPLSDAIEEGDVKKVDNLLLEQFRSDMKIWTAYNNKLV